MQVGRLSRLLLLVLVLAACGASTPSTAPTQVVSLSTVTPFPPTVVVDVTATIEVPTVVAAQPTSEPATATLEPLPSVAAVENQLPRVVMADAVW